MSSTFYSIFSVFSISYVTIVHTKVHVVTLLHNILENLMTEIILHPQKRLEDDLRQIQDHNLG